MLINLGGGQQISQAPAAAHDSSSPIGPSLMYTSGMNDVQRSHSRYLHYHGFERPNASLVATATFYTTALSSAQAASIASGSFKPQVRDDTYCHYSSKTG